MNDESMATMNDKMCVCGAQIQIKSEMSPAVFGSVESQNFVPPFTKCL